MEVGLGCLWKCIIYRVLFPKEIAQRSRNCIWLSYFSSPRGGFEWKSARCLYTEFLSSEIGLQIVSGERFLPHRTIG